MGLSDGEGIRWTGNRCRELTQKKQTCVKTSLRRDVRVLYREGRKPENDTK